MARRKADSADYTGTELVVNGVSSRDRTLIIPESSVLVEPTSGTTKGSARGVATRVTDLPADTVNKIV
jgi:hypothetical protein